MLSGDESTKGWGCSTCKGPAYKEQDVHREARGCVPGKKAAPTIAFGWAPELNRCPYAAISEQAWQYMACWSDYCLLSVLPEPGDLGDQPAHVFEAIRICEQTRAELEANEAQKARRAREKAEEQARINALKNR